MDLEEFQLCLIPLTADEFSALATAWQDIARVRTEAMIDATNAAQTKEGGVTQADLHQIVTLTETPAEVFDRYSAFASGFEKKGGDEATVAGLRAYRNAILIEEKQQADFRTLVTQTLNWAVDPDGGVGLLYRFVVIVASLIGLVLVARIVCGYAKRLFRRLPDLSKLLQAFLAMVAYWITIAIGLMVVLSALGVDITPLFALVGGASFILAFAMQETLGNHAAGLMIMFNRPSTRAIPSRQAAQQAR